MIVDSNVGFNKVDPNIDESADLKIELDRTGSSTVQLSLTYRHLVERPTAACLHEAPLVASYGDLMERCYWDYVRVYAPSWAERVESAGWDGPVVAYSESGRAVLAGPLLIAPGLTR